MNADPGWHRAPPPRHTANAALKVLGLLALAAALCFGAAYVAMGIAVSLWVAS